MLILPDRTAKPRKQGITSIHDVSLTIREMGSILDDYGDYLDIAKFGVGTAYLTPKLEEKIALYKQYNVKPYFGGTLFEMFFSQNKLDEYLKYLQKLSINVIEVSVGTISIPLETRKSLIRELTGDFEVFAEVGSKDTDKIMPPSEWLEEIDGLMNAGAQYVITEGRDSATSGVFRPSREIRTGLIDDILHYCDVSRLIFEAPTSSSQMYFINLVGPNVNLGNIRPADLLLLETQRVGLRYETFGGML